jgi:hypothetical protein
MFKKNILLIVALALVALFLVIPAWPGTLPTSIIPDGARWVAHVDMEKFVATKLYEYLNKDGRLEIKNRDITRMLKIDLFKDITGLTVFGLEPGEKRAVFAAAGKFDKTRLLTLLSLDDDHREIQYDAHTIYSMGDHEFGAFVNDGLIIFADHREDIEKVLDTAAGKAKNFASSKLNAAFKDISSAAFVSAVVEDLAGLGKEIRQSRFVEKANLMFFLAQEKQESLQVRVQVTADTPESAQDMADIAQGLIALARLGTKENHEVGASSLVQAIQVKLEGKTVRLELDRPAREIADLVSRGRGAGRFFRQRLGF